MNDNEAHDLYEAGRNAGRSCKEEAPYRGTGRKSRIYHAGWRKGYQETWHRFEDELDRELTHQTQTE